MTQNPFQVEFYRTCDFGMQIQSAYVLLFVINGNVHVTSAHRSYDLGKEDYMIINSGKEYRMCADEDTLLVKISFDKETMCRLAHNESLWYYCISVDHQGSKYEKFRFVIRELLGLYAIEPNDINPDKMSSLYKICAYMNRYFVISPGAGSTYEDRSKTEQVFHYVEEHYRDKITLEDAAGAVYMVPTSFSRYFSRETGMSFVNYVNKVRLEHAVQEMLTSDQSITDILMNNGFGSVSQFHKYFRKTYHMSPREYCAYIRTQSQDVGSEDGVLREELQQYQSKTRLTVVKEQRYQVQEIQINIREGIECTNPWKSALNLGFASYLLNAEYQRQIAFLKQSLSFEYGIINGIFSYQLKLISENEPTLNYVLLDQILDFLVEQRIHPFLVIDDQVDSMLKELNERNSIQCREVFHNEQQLRSVIGEIMEHVIYRYGMREVSTWYFSLWYDEFHGTTLGLKNDYADVWDWVYDEIRARIPNAKIGGAGMGPSVSRDILVQFYTNWKKAKNLPDFIYFHAFPYRETDSKLKLEAIRCKVEDFFMENISDIKSILTEVGLSNVPLVAQEWNLSFIQRNMFNDMAGKAAIAIRQMIQSIGELEMAAYWPACDLYAGDYDANRLLNGACGLISANAVYKPVFYALEFMGELLRFVVKRGKNYIVTRDDRGNFVIILHNYKGLNYNYYSKREEQIKAEDELEIYENLDALEIKITLENMQNKSYSIQKQTIGPNRGSVLDEWRRLGLDTPLTISDITYLRNQCVPCRKNERLAVDDGRMVLLESLKAHEIMLLKIH